MLQFLLSYFPSISNCGPYPTPRKLIVCFFDAFATNKGSSYDATVHKIPCVLKMIVTILLEGGIDVEVDILRAFVNDDVLDPHGEY